MFKKSKIARPMYVKNFIILFMNCSNVEST